MGGFFEAMLINKKVVFYSLKEEEYRYKDLINNFDLPYITDINNFKSVLSKDYDIQSNQFIKYDKNEKAVTKIVDIIKNELDAK